MSGGPYPLPNAHAAFVAEGKIRDYLLNPQHPGNGGKAGFFTSYGFSLRDWHKLAEALQKHAAAHAVTRTRPSAYGTRFEIRGRLGGRLESPDRSNPYVRSIWVVDPSNSNPRLVTAYPG
jgi:hypothetical protein